MIGESIKYGWSKVKENLQISIFSTLLLFVVGIVSGGGRGFFRSLLAIAATVFMFIVRIGYNKIFLRINDGEKPMFTDIFKEYKLFWKFLGLSILYPLTVLLGLILLIIPGIIWIVRFSFSPLILVDTKMGPIASMKESWAITRGNFWKLVLFWIVVALVNFAGFLLLGVGLLVTVPLTTLASIYIYRELSKAKAAVIVLA